MPELPDIEAYISALRRTIEGHIVRNVRLKSVFLVQSIDPPFDSLEGSTVVDFRRIGKRIVFELEHKLDREGGTTRFWMILHLMISGRLRWGKPGAGLPGRMGLCALDFDHGSLVITEASKKKRATIYLTREKSEVEVHNPGGLEIAELDLSGFAEALSARNHTLKWALTDPRILSGIGGSYADGKLLADRSLSRLLKKDWPRTPEELEEMRFPAVRSSRQDPGSKSAGCSPEGAKTGPG